MATITTSQTISSTCNIPGILSRFLVSSQSNSSANFTHTASTSGPSTGTVQSCGPCVSLSSRAQDLPPELLVAIFQIVISDAFKSLYAYRSDPYQASFIRTSAMEIPKLTGAQLTLSAATRVCRSWHLSGSSILYTRPFVCSHDSVRRFSRTVRNSPDLGRLVKYVIALDITSTPSRTPERRQHLPLDWPTADGKVRTERGQARIELMAALECCPKLQSVVLLTTCAEPNSSILPVDGGLISNSTLSSLRTLTLHGSAMTQNSNKYPFSLSSKVHMPSLETLCLRNVYFPPGCQFPQFPRLHTLHLSQCSSVYAGRPHPIEIPHSAIPSLRTLELYENRTRIVFERETMQQLERLHHIGAEESCITSLWGSLLTENFEHLEHITVGFNGDAESAAIEQLPSQLRSLTVHVQLDYDLLQKERRAANPAILGSLHTLFASTSSPMPKSFKDVYVVVAPSIAAQTERELRLPVPRQLEALYEDGAKRGFNVHVRVQEHAGTLSQRIAPLYGESSDI